MIGRTLAHYRITAALGAGGMGEVWRATDTKLGRDVALKVLPEEFVDDPQRLDRFEREARAVAALNHPHIVTIHSVEEADGVRFLTMELIEGRSLDKLIPEGGLELGPFFELATPLAEAISAAHDKSVIHRDLKPSNVMVDGDGRVKVLDFGLAKLQQPEGVSESTELPTEALTGVGVIVGTVPYMSPEQIEGQMVDHRTDIFSLGILLYEMATGERPFSGASQPALMSSILKDAPQSVVEVRGDLPRHLGRIIARCLEKDRRDRYQTARDVFNELRALQRESTSMGAPGARPAAGPSRTMPRPSSPSAVSSSAVSADEGFWVAVLPFKYNGGDADLTALAEGLSEDIVTGLSRFSYLRVIARSSTFKYASEGIDVRAVGDELGARYVMEGSLRKAGKKLRLAVQLVDTDSGAHLWAEAYDRDFDAEDLFALQDELVPRIVSTVADTHGVLPRSMGEALRSCSSKELSPYEAVLRSFSYFERVSAEELAAARTALELAVQKAPDYADAWAMLALLCAQEYGQGFKLLADPLESGANAARRAVEAGPSNHLAHFSLAQVLFFQKDFGTFRNAAARAAELNPMDGNSIAFLGELLTYAGDSERGLELSGRAKQLNPTHPGWYWYADFFHAYRERDYPAALAIAQKVNLPDHWGQHVAIAVAYGQLGDHEAARRARKRLLEIRPDFVDIARQEFEKWWDPVLVEHMIEGLRKAGLGIPPALGSEVASTGTGESRGPGSGAVRTDEGFWIAVLPFRYRGSDPGVETLAEGLADEIVSGLSRFSFLRVIASTSTAKYTGEAAEVGSVGRELGARYVIEGSIRQAGSTLRVSAQLVDTDSGAHLWAETYERPFLPEAVFELQDDLVPRIVSTVGDAHGILPHTMSELLRSKPPDQLTPYEAVLRSFGYGYRRTPEEHAVVRAALERAVEQAPRYADALAMLALVYADEHSHGYNKRPDPIVRALRAARRAAEAAPSNAMALNALAWAMFFSNEVQAFRAAAEQSIRLNPLNGPTLAGLGALTSYSGDWERGSALVERAVELNPRHPGWYWFPLFYKAYREGDYRGAVKVALKINLPEFFVTHEALAAAYGQLGESDAAGKALREMLRLKPDYAQTGRERLEKWFDAELVEHLTDGLRKAGLEKPALAPSGVEGLAPETAAVAIAVLPFSDMSPARDQEYLCEGMAEEIMNALVRVEGMRVASRTSAFRARQDGGDLPAIANALSVNHVLEGSVRTSGSRLRVTAQLTDVASGYQLWSERFDREAADIFAVQDEIAAGVVEAVKARLAPGAGSVQTRGHVRNLEAYRFYLKGRHLRGKEDHEGARRAFEEAIGLDPSHAPSWTGLAEITALAAHFSLIPANEACAAARKALATAAALQGESAEGLHVEAFVAFIERRWAAMEAVWRRALELQPTYVLALGALGLSLCTRQRLHDALPFLERAREADPLASFPYVRTAVGLLINGRPEEALRYAEDGLTFERDDVTGVLAAAIAKVALGRLEEGIAAAEQAVSLSRRGAFFVGVLGWVLATAGRNGEAQAILDELRARPADSPTVVSEAWVLGALGEVDEAFDVLERAEEEYQAMLYYTGFPGFDPLRTDPRFAALLTRLELPSP